jgi:micrococcal nuclease
LDARLGPSEAKTQLVALGTLVATVLTSFGRLETFPWRPIRAATLVVLLVLGWSGGTSTLGAQPKADPRLFVGLTFSATVTSVLDGDTVRVALANQSTLTIRLDGIDTPEIGEPYSADARNATRVMLFTKRAQFRGTDVDRYSRLVARITVDGADSSLELVKRGLACHFIRYSSDQQLAAAQRTAQERGLGFWGQGAPKPVCARATLRAQTPSRIGTAFHGNTSSHIFHAAGCKNYNCRNCTVVFSSAKQAEAAEYRPARDCLR